VRFFAALLRNKIPRPWIPAFAGRTKTTPSVIPGEHRETRNDGGITRRQGSISLDARLRGHDGGREMLLVSASALSATRYGVLRMTPLSGHVIKCTNVVWFDLVR